jgi:hypothetical protein
LSFFFFCHSFFCETIFCTCKFCERSFRFSLINTFEKHYLRKNVNPSTYIILFSTIRHVISTRNNTIRHDEARRIDNTSKQIFMDPLERISCEKAESIEEKELDLQKTEQESGDDITGVGFLLTRFTTRMRPSFEGLRKAEDACKTIL